MSANTGSFNIQQFLRGVNNKINVLKGSTGNTTSIIPSITDTKSNFARIIAYVLAIIIVIFVILLFINFFITPIFRLKPGGPGIIPIPGFDDGKLFWNTTNSGMIQNKDLPIVSQSFDYTVGLDIFIENPLQFSIAPRVFFSRGGIAKQKPSGDTLLSVLDNYNLSAALLPDTSDMIVSVLNVNNNMENIIISNIPVQQPFRLTMVVMQQALEVYINGNLMKTRMFSAPPKSVLGDIYPSTGIEINVTKVRNLKIWSRILTIGEIKFSTPSLSTVKEFGAGKMSSSTSYMPSSINDITNDMTDAKKIAHKRYSKLSVDTVSDETSKLL
jgi:hypothetical protein